MSRVIRLLTLGALVLAVPLGAQQRRPAQRAATPAVVHFAPYVGYMIFGDYLTGPVGTSLTTQAAPVFGAQLGLDVAPNVSIVGNVGTSSSNMQVGLPFIGGVNIGTTRVLLYDADLHLGLADALGTRSAVTPFVEGGVGGIKYDIKNSLFSTTSTSLAGNVGAGLDYAVSPSIGVRLMAKDYISKFDFQEATRFDIQGKTSHNIALSAGVTIGF